MAPAVGIDLGTTNTVVAVSQGGQTRVLLDESGANLLPSVVSWHPDGRVLVGREARRRRVVDARSTVHSIKRLLGRRWGGPEVERARRSSTFELVEGPKRSIEVAVRGMRYPLPTVSALVVGRAKQIAEQALGETITQAVITVPASFNDLQRSATRRAAKEAGLEVLRILNEPTAAALAYGLGTRTAERLAVYDFGGGTFDLTLLDVSDNLVEVLATSGDSFLGGDDVDAAIAQVIGRAMLRDTGVDANMNIGVVALLRAAAEHLKMQLSTLDRADVELKAVGYAEGGHPIDYKYELSRSELEMIAKPFVDRTIAVCDDALRQSRLDVAAFGSVILVGGSSKMPYVQERVEAFFGKVPRIEYNPDEVVAVGAAIMAAVLTGQERPAEPMSMPKMPRAAGLPADLSTGPGAPPLPVIAPQPVPLPPPPPPIAGQPHMLPSGRSQQLPAVPSVLPMPPERPAPLLIDVTPLTLSVETIAGMVDVIIERNTAVPCTRKRRYTTSVDGQTEVLVRVVQGEGAVASQNAVLGELVMSGLRPARRGDLWIEVSFELDADGILQLRAVDEAAGREVQTQLRVTAQG
jgi:molecular chaperone DnaK